MSGTQLEEAHRLQERPAARRNCRIAVAAGPSQVARSTADAHERAAARFPARQPKMSRSAQAALNELNEDGPSGRWSPAAMTPDSGATDGGNPIRFGPAHGARRAVHPHHSLQEACFKCSTTCAPSWLVCAKSEGQTLIEYALLAFLIAIVSIVLLAAIGLDLAETFDEVENALGLGAHNTVAHAGHRRRGRAGGRQLARSRQAGARAACGASPPRGARPPPAGALARSGASAAPPQVRHARSRGPCHPSLGATGAAPPRGSRADPDRVRRPGSARLDRRDRRPLGDRPGHRRGLDAIENTLGLGATNTVDATPASTTRPRHPASTEPRLPRLARGRSFDDAAPPECTRMLPFVRQDRGSPARPLHSASHRSTPPL